jgi:hypothetical protein
MVFLDGIDFLEIWRELRGESSVNCYFTGGLHHGLPLNATPPMASCEHVFSSRRRTIQRHVSIEAKSSSHLSNTNIQVAL